MEKSEGAEESPGYAQNHQAYGLPLEVGRMGPSRGLMMDEVSAPHHASLRPAATLSQFLRVFRRQRHWSASHWSEGGKHWRQQHRRFCRNPSQPLTLTEAAGQDNSEAMSAQTNGNV